MAFDHARLVEEIDRALTARSLTAVQASAEIGIDDTTLSRIRHGRVPDVQTVAALVEWLGVSADAFFESSVARPGASVDIVVPLEGGGSARIEIKTAGPPPTRAQLQRVRRISEVVLAEVLTVDPSTGAAFHDV